MPEERWNVDSLYSEDPSARGRMYVRRVSFLRWDFRQSTPPCRHSPVRRHHGPSAAPGSDAALDTLHNARVDFDALAGSATGVFMGGFMLDHLTGNAHFTVRERMTNHSPTSAMATMLSNRVSVSLGLQGPSLTVDTACSSSLVAVVLACRPCRPATPICAWPAASTTC